MSVANSDALPNGEDVYHALKEQLEREYYGAYAMIDLRGGEYVIGNTMSEVHGKFIVRYGAVIVDETQAARMGFAV